MKEWLFKYIDTFDENFPTHMMMGKTEAEIVSTIKKCIEEGKPYMVEEDGSIY